MPNMFQNRVQLWHHFCTGVALCCSRVRTVTSQHAAAWVTMVCIPADRMLHMLDMLQCEDTVAKLSARQSTHLLTPPPLVLLIAVTYVLVNLTVDILYGLLDPRVRDRDG